MFLRLLKPSFIITITTVIVFCIIVLPSQFIFNDPELQEYLTEMIPSGYLGMIIIFFILGLLTSVALPRQIAAFTCGYSFGFIDGVIIATLATTLGCYLTFITSRKILQSWVVKQKFKQQKYIIDFLNTDLFYKAIIIRILPIGSNFLTNIITGACSVPLKQYLLGSFIGFIPQMIIFSLAGSGTKLGDSTHLIISLILFLMASLIGIWLYKKHKRSSAFI